VLKDVSSATSLILIKLSLFLRLSVLLLMGCSPWVDEGSSPLPSTTTLRHAMKRQNRTRHAEPRTKVPA
jgi:hypothetical protein